MGCFSLFPCFNKRNLNKSVYNPSLPSSVHQGNEESYCESDLIKLPTQGSTNLGSIQIPISKAREDSENLLVNDSGGEQVAIDLDIKINNLDVESEDFENENKESGKLGFLVHLESEKEREIETKKGNGKLGALVQIGNEKEMNLEYINVEIDNVEVESVKDRKMEPKEADEGLRAHTLVENDKQIEQKEESQYDEEKEVKTEERKNEVQSRVVSESSVSSYISYPPMHRYHNYVINEDEEEGEDQVVVIQESSSESLFSVSINPRRKQKYGVVEVDDDKEVNSPLKVSSSPKRPEVDDQNQVIDYLLNPIENLAQWKTIKARPMPILEQHLEKENVCLEQEDIPIQLTEEPISKVSDMKGKRKNDTAVTTSLSSWLVEPEKSTASKEESQYSAGNSYAYSDGATSWKSFEDRPILGAWTIKEVRQVSARSSPRKSPSHDHDEMPIIGTVGSYWSHTGQATDFSNSCSTSPMGMSAKSRRNREKASSCHSTPYKRRLDRTFDRTAV
uniref:uncharacterized protein LOC122605359 isoform X2 n=1 Tax=Erigeron canadensis TaxID=72917 RepID=UPI001CB8E29C|nr:uncharacterized protein LOC122605359 isoform X2 [Erigeron canadensis]